MKKCRIILKSLFLLLITPPLYPAVYEASTLYNSVTRAETVQDLFLDRWDILKEKNFYFDINGKINWVFGFEVNTYNAGTDKYESTDLRLTRTYGSMTIAIPFDGFREDPEGSDFIMAISTTGFHYGLTKDLDVDRGDAGSETISDYKHSQFFDDIYALSILWRPDITFHAGFIINNEYIPEDDGTMDYFDPVKSYRKKFFAMELYSVMAFSINIDGGKPESTELEIKLKKPLSYFIDTTSIYFPQITLGYMNQASYNDELYDPVWVRTPSGKGDMAEYSKDSAMLNIYSVTVNQRFTKSYTIEGHLGLQQITDKIYTKTDEKKINIPPAKEWSLLLAYDPLKAEDEAGIKAYTGLSWYWDPAVAIHRKNPEKGNAVYGWILGFDLDFILIGANLMAEYNFSSELKKLVEASDKWAVEGSAFFRI